ncbi:MAG TPA: cytochrome P450 [Solirubrobacteraceae bacterium]|nr:cytochrome P450 [Solirubrobacteraceae bacterium]
MIHTSNGALPAGPPLPRAAQTAGFLLREPRFLEHCRERYGDVFTLDLMGRAVQGPGAAEREARWVFLADPDHVKQLFTADPAVVLTGATNVFLQGAVGPRSILVLDEPEHMTQRKLMLPAFHGERVHAYRELIAEVTRAELARWPVGRPFPLWPRMQAITLEVIVRAVFGIAEPSRLAHVRDVLRTMLNRMTAPRWLAAHMLLVSVAGRDRVGDWRSVRRLLGPVDDAINSEIRRRRVAADLDERDDVLSMLLLARTEDGSSLSDEDLHDELMTLLIAGHESTATSLRGRSSACSAIPPSSSACARTTRTPTPW